MSHLAAWAAQPDASARTEIAYLLTFVKTSACQFNRNGSWHPSTEAAAHIERKYEYVLGKGMVATAEDFIRLAATQSSYSGTAYTVKCDGNVLKSADWLTQALHLFRKQH
ncbi:DUF5329 domain-containing protein [Hydrogenophaga sp. 5NK40-0174]|uniref:DUF5329 domain-containing protein n=1 Tax=Hydrogenophaga sp. 5NK40-0174 TaxID=3127649 RepID=UPI0033425CBE